MAITRRTVSIALRTAEALFAVIILGLSAGVLAGYNTNIPSVTFNLIISIFDIFWLVYIAFIAPKVFANKTQTAVVLTCQLIIWVFFLVAFILILSDFPKDCNKAIYMRDSIDTCRANQTILAFAILNYVVLNTELALFYSYTLVPESKTFGGKHLLQKTTYHWGTLFTTEITTTGTCCGSAGAGVGVGASDAVDKESDVSSRNFDEEAAVGDRDVKA